MNALLAEVSNMVTEDRIERIESDVVEIKGGLKVLTKEFQDFKTAVAKEFGSLRTEVVTEFGSFRAEVAREFGLFRAEVAKEFGSVRAEIESLRTTVERTKVWMLCTGISTVLGVAAIVGFKLH
ncbi:MAG TPA: hypothetical protein VG672_26505 [Bryobacteraceae bacterium]|nr:hypothetical protein [Bryobacteraceae bacterium]